MTLITWGAMTKETRQAVSVLGAEGVAVELIDLRSLAPLDEDAIVASVQKTGTGGGCPEAPRTAGFGAEIAALIQERCLYALSAPIERVTGWDTVFPLKRSEHHYVPSVSGSSPRPDAPWSVMAKEFRLPDIGEGLTEAEIVHWHVAVGESVAQDGPLVEVETDKAVVDIHAPVGGVLLHQGARPATRCRWSRCSP